MQGNEYTIESSVMSENAYDLGRLLFVGREAVDTGQGVNQRYQNLAPKSVSTFKHFNLTT